MKRVAFVVNGGETSAMAERARAFARRLSPSWDPVIAYQCGSRRASLTRFAAELRSAAPDVIYVLDMAAAGVGAALCHGILARTPVVIDSGDAITALAYSAGLRGPLGLAATAALECASTWLADALVVRGSHHREWLAKRGIDATVIPDGVDLDAFRPLDAARRRESLGLDGAFVIGVLGSCVWSRRLGITYGWDLVEALALLRDLPVKGLLIGDGSGLPYMLDRARKLGVDDRLVCVGRQPFDALPELLNVCDVCLSTQTNNLAGRVRTTGKLPLYLACGRFVLASAVGEAARVLPPNQLLPYDGVVDRMYPVRLAERLREVMRTREDRHVTDANVAIARAHFDYRILAERLEAVLTRTLSGDRAAVGRTAAV